MAEGKNTIDYLKIEECYNILYSPITDMNYKYGLTYITPENMILINEALSYLRKVHEIDGHTCNVVRKIYHHFSDNYFKIKEAILQEPRIIAQSFLSKNNVREFIFKRDGYKCLKCGSTKNLTLDHIVPVHKGGVNRLGNLQTLCRKCNSSKSIKIIDYR
jgi:hypothetical protein